MKFVKLSILSLLFLAPNLQAQENVQQADPNQVLATVNGQNITRAELEKFGGKNLIKQEMELYDYHSSLIDGLIDKKLLEIEAKSQGKTVSQLRQENINSKVKDPSDAEVEAFYKKNQRRFAKYKREQVIPFIKNRLKSDARKQVREAYLAELSKKYKHDKLMKRPHPIQRAKITINPSDPSQGNANAPIKLVEFTDYQCPFCVKARPVIEQVLKTYPNQIHYVLKDFPLSFHKEAPKASEAAHCAKDQNKYWEYSDLLWENQGDLRISSLKKYAKSLNLNMGDFNTCLDKGKYSQLVENNLKEGKIAGVSGTPAFYINGRQLSGARPFAQFKQIIDEELKLKK
jgi:protein-disulfide isomerase